MISLCFSPNRPCHALIVILSIWVACPPSIPGAVPACQNVLLVTVDGLRIQEVFAGADRLLLSKEGGVRNVARTEANFWRASSTARREALMPFFWSTIARRGQVFGDPEHDCVAVVTNGLYFSYPGYNEILAGKSDPSIDSNDKQYNPNVTVLEWLHNRQEYRGQMAAFCSWDVFPFIINTQRCKIPVNAGWTPLKVGDAATIQWLNGLAGEVPHYWDNVRYDVFTATGALEYLKAKKPRVVYISVGETDDWAHDGRYDLYLDAAHRTDRFLKQLWETVQSLPEYRDRTAVVLTTDHGRGDGREGWKSHGVDYPGSERIWIAAWGAGVSARGIRENLTVTQSQVAATVAHLLGLDFQRSGTGIADPLPLGADSTP